MPPDDDVNTFESESAYDAFQSGSYDYFRGEYDKAIMHFGRALRSESDVGSVYNRRGLAYQAKGDHERALADFERALECMPDSAMVYNNRARSHYATGDYGQAIVDLNRAVGLQADFGKAYYNRGLIYYAMGDYDRAIADLSEAVELSSSWPSYRRTLPSEQAYDAGRDPLAGLENKLRAMQTRADLPKVYLNRGLAYLAKGAYDSAISDLDRAIDLQPDLSAAYYARGMAHLGAGNDDEARADCQAMLEQGDDPELQHLAEEVRSLCDLVTSGHDVSPPTNEALPTRTPGDVPAEEPSMPIAVFVAEGHNARTTPTWEGPPVSCDGKPLHMWRLPGRYLYKGFTDSGREYFAAVELTSREMEPGEGRCRMPWPSFGDSVTEPPTAGLEVTSYYDFCDRDHSRPPGAVSITVVGVEQKSIGLGTYEAVRVDTLQRYHFTQSINHPQGSVTTSEWYVCGYGLIRSETSHTGKYQGRDFESKYGIELASFTPTSTSESHVRYIVADNQLSNVVEYYRLNVADEETAEALRRWDAGVRVANIDEFEREVVDGQWQIVHVGTDRPVTGTDIILTSDPPQ